ncbi:MAG: hypothetical protein H0T53_12800, partial [Herpetosiphonaceae bacterium]|nr:hypothetical protein [Herpetosiphonaceae bacterium]
MQPFEEIAAQYDEIAADGNASMVEVTQIERQLKTTGVGLLTGGLSNWAASTMSYSGAASQLIDPTKDSPFAAPPVLVVPSGALEAYRNFPTIKLWLDQYTTSGGTLVVLSQPYGRNWEWLPGGEVRGLGYEEDIFCREESVDVVGESPYLAGMVKERPSLQLDGSFTQYPAATRVLLKRRTGNVMPAMIEYPHGAGKVIATSLFPDFAPVNGSQSAEDMAFARSFFLQAWREATEAPLVKKLGLNDDPIVPVTITNNGRLPLRYAQVTSDISAGVSPDMWRYRIHYDDSDVFHSTIHAATVSLSPPLAVGETRVVAVTFPALPAPGFHRIGVRGQPADLYQVDAGLKYTLPAQMRISTDQAAYWLDDIVQITTVFSPTPALTTTRSLTLKVLGDVLPPVAVTLEPGVVVTKTATLQATEAVIGRSLRFRLVNPQTNGRVVDGLLPLNIQARATPVRLRMPFDTRVHWVGDSIDQAIQLQPTALLSETIQVRLESQPPLLTPLTVTLTPGSPLSVTSSLSISASLISAPLRIRASNAATGALLTENQIWLRVIPPQPHMDVALAGSASETGLPFVVRNIGGVSTSYSTTVELLDGAERVIASMPVSGTLDRAAANTHAATSHAYTLTLPGNQATSSRYSLRYQIAASPDEWRGRLPVFVPGLTVQLETQTERPTYLVHEAITATTTISTSAPLSDAWLRLQVLRLGNGTIPDVATFVGTAGAQGASDGVGSSARFYWPYATALSGDGRFALIADSYNHTIRYAEIATGVVSTLAGTAGASGNANGGGTLARFSRPRGVAVSSDSTFALVADTNNHTIRRIALSNGEVTTLAGSPGVSGSTNGVGAAARFTYPDDVVISGDGAFALVADNGNHTIRRIELATGAVSTLAGLAGQTGSTNGAGSSARFNAPQGIALSSDGTFALVADTNNATIRRVTVATGYVVTLAGRAGNFGSIDGVGGTARFSAPQGLAITPDGKTALVADTTNHTIRRLDISTRRVTTVAGSAGLAGSTDGISDQARFRRPRSIAISADGTLALIVDSDNHTIRSLGFATLLRENWLPVSGADPISLDYAMLNPALADDVRARGQLLLRGTLYGAQPATTFPSQRQVLAVDQAGFMLATGNYTVSLIPDQEFVRIDTPAVRDDQAAQVHL